MLVFFFGGGEGGDFGSLGIFWESNYGFFLPADQVDVNGCEYMNEWS